MRGRRENRISNQIDFTTRHNTRSRRWILGGIRWEQMKSVGIFFTFSVLAFAGPSFGPKVPDTPEVQAHLLDHNEYQCANCFFGATTYYYCFEADNKVLIGYQKIPTMNWMDPDKNWLTKYHKAWQPGLGKEQEPEGQNVPLRYDEKYIWLTAPTGKPARLKQDYTTDIFVNNTKCRTAVKKK